MTVTHLSHQTDHAMPTKRKPLFWVGLICLLIIVNILALLYWRNRPPDEGSPAVIFARDMAAHHEQAVEIALLVRERSTDAELRQLALDILLSQQAQIGQMQGWLAVWGLPLAGAQPPMAGQAAMMGMATQQEVNTLQILPLAEAEISFLQLMIRHHQGGVAMAEVALRQTGRAEVIRLATAIIQSQQSEITYMQRLLNQRGGKPLPPPSPMISMDY